MDEYSFKVVTPQTLAFLRNQATPDAPWGKLPEQAWTFLEDSIAVDLPWRVDNNMLLAYTQPTSKASRRRQEDAREDLTRQPDLLRAFPSGLGWFERRYLGRLLVEEGREEPVLEPASPQPPAETLLIGLASVFWPDMPPAVWNQVLPLLVKRETEEVHGFGGGPSMYAIDTMDFGRAYRFLAAANKLAVQPVFNWANAIDPPMPSATSIRPRRK